MKNAIRERFKSIQEAREKLRNIPYSTTRWITPDDFVAKIRGSSMASDSVVTTVP